eukprot:TRINITY_DN4065_c0_g3_i5.p1 TRINITY_DN4065_c0_g3~~TRINITY_DN4065_c0_g3_i5.p1  ORF type:complete len:217 (-),score=56.43 TRINITY_DN4065_c0_g3_i5:108-758(-)
MYEEALKHISIIYDRAVSREKRHEDVLPWWNSLHAELLEQKLTKEKFREIIVKSNFMFRHGIVGLLKATTEHNVNFVISSAGIVGIIEQSIEMLKATTPLKDPLYFGTSEEYDDNGVLVKFKEPVITTLNKSSVITHENCPFVKKGTNAILLGDITDDLFITEKLQLENLITIGFFNNEAKTSKEEYVKAFDVTIMDDGDLTYVTELINRIYSDSS